MARVYPLNQVQIEGGEGWILCLQWCRYDYDDFSSQYGYRFIWRRPEAEGGGLQAARGQARIPRLEDARELTAAAVNAGWGDRNGDEMEAAAKRLTAAGCAVIFRTGYVGWPNCEAASAGRLTETMIEDERLIREWGARA